MALTDDADTFCRDVEAYLCRKNGASVLVATADVRSAIGFSSFAVLTYYAVANASAWTLPGTTGMLVRTHHNYAWVGLFNTRSLTANLEAELDAALWKALAGVTSFPAHDLFSTFR